MLQLHFIYLIIGYILVNTGNDEKRWTVTDTHCNRERVLRKQQRVKFVIKIVLVTNVKIHI